MIRYQQSNDTNQYQIIQHLCLHVLLCITAMVNHKQKYRQTLYLAVCSENVVGGILNWWNFKLVDFITVWRKTHACSINELIMT